MNKRHTIRVGDKVKFNSLQDRTIYTIIGIDLSSQSREIHFEWVNNRGITLSIWTDTYDGLCNRIRNGKVLLFNCDPLTPYYGFGFNFEMVGKKIPEKNYWRN
jgi:hypothetical protein